MANLDRVVNVQISLNTTGISVEGFNTMLAVGAHAHSLARVETYTSASDMITAGFSDTDPLYLAAVDLHFRYTAIVTDEPGTFDTVNIHGETPKEMNWTITSKE